MLRKIDYMQAIIWAQDRLPPNIPQWNIDYFELKLLKNSLNLLSVSVKAENKSLI